MKLIINIPEVFYEALKKTDEMVSGQRSGKTLMSVIYNAVANGTPLPKGHGRLIDADAFIATLEDASKRHKYKELLIDDCLTVDDVFKAVIESLQNRGLAEGDAPTIIEADVESEGEE